MDSKLINIGVGLKAQLVFIVIISVSFFYKINAQTIGHHFGTFDYSYKEISGIVNQEEHFKNDRIKGFFIDYPIFNEFSVTFLYTYYWGWTNFRAKDDLRSIGNGSAYTKLNRFGLQLNWDVIKYKKQLILSPYIRIGYEHNDVQIPGITNSRNYLPEPNNNYAGSIFVETFDGGQILPTLGLRLSIRPFWKFWIYGDLSYSLGHKTYQRLYFDYTYKGVEQPRAEWHSQGSGLIKSIGIGIQLWDTTKGEENEARRIRGNR